jgi:predicted lipoprotein with Yx(FWY)xxD motif
MWYTARRILALTFLGVVISVGAASAQYNAPAAPSAPAAPAAPAPTPSAPATSVPGPTGMYPFAVNVAFAPGGTEQKIVLTDAQGMTLYYLKNEYSTATMCTGTCASVWPPALAPAVAMVDPALSPVAVINNVNGPQIAYHGHLLYRFSKDTAPAQLNGDGVVDTWGQWAAATPDLYYQP